MCISSCVSRQYSLYQWLLRLSCRASAAGVQNAAGFILTEQFSVGEHVLSLDCAEALLKAEAFPSDCCVIYHPIFMYITGYIYHSPNFEIWGSSMSIVHLTVCPGLAKKANGILAWINNGLASRTRLSPCTRCC